jgi:hypothetical protein
MQSTAQWGEEDLITNNFGSAVSAFGPRPDMERGVGVNRAGDTMVRGYSYNTDSLGRMLYTHTSTICGLGYDGNLVTRVDGLFRRHLLDEGVTRPPRQSLLSRYSPPVLSRWA